MGLHPVVHRAVRLLGGGFALNLAAFAMVAGPGSVAMVRLTGDLHAAGLFFSLYLVGASLGAPLGGWGMDRWGRRAILALAFALGGVGYAIAGVAFALDHLGGFVAGIGLVSVCGGIVALSRVAAADMFPPARRGEAVAKVFVVATAGAIVGPLFLVGSEPLGAWLGRDPAGLVWFAAAPLLLLGGALVSRIPEPMEVARNMGAYFPGEATEAVRPAATARRSGRLALAAGVGAIALSLAAMTSVMGVTGAALTHAGHGVASIGGAMTLHFLGMYAFSPWVGRFADRAGRRAAILAGAIILGLGGALIALQPGPLTLAGGLLLIGLGWCFANLGGTVLVTEVVPLARRARVMGAVELGASLLGGAATAAAGALLAQQGLGGVGLFAVVLMLAPLTLASIMPKTQRHLEVAHQGQSGPE